MITLTAVILTAAMAPAMAADVPGAYPRMAPIEQYLMPDRQEEIALARTAALPEVSKEATIWVLTRAGYEIAVKGSNGFACFVGRSWHSPLFVRGQPYPDFWNPKVRAPTCYNPDAVATVFPLHLKRTDWALAGASLDEIHERTGLEVRDGNVRTPPPTALAYMMSHEQYLGDRAHHFVPHLMFYLAHATDKELGSQTPGSPLFVGESAGSPLAVVLVPLARWSDGTEVQREAR